MNRPPQAPGSIALHDALDRSDPLRGLLQRVQASNARHAIVAALLPPGLRELVRPGPLDAEGWVLLVPHGSAASKLRQMLPQLEQSLKEHGQPPLAIKIKVQPSGVGAA